MRQKEAYGARRRKFEPLFEHKKTAYSFLSHTRAGAQPMSKLANVTISC